MTLVAEDSEQVNGRMLRESLAGLGDAGPDAGNTSLGSVSSMDSSEVFTTGQLRVISRMVQTSVQLAVGHLKEDVRSAARRALEHEQRIQELESEVQLLRQFVEEMLSGEGAEDPHNEEEIRS